METIKFNRNYKKLHGQTSAILVYKDVMFPEQLKKEFIEYDTEGAYEIVDHSYLVLYFVGNKYIPFSTLRKNNAENRKKYLDCELYTTFKIEVQEQTK